MPKPDDLPYVPAPSLGHELGIMFGFLGLMAVAMGLYLIGWQHANIHGQRKEAERIETLRASGFLKQRQEETEERSEEKRSSIRDFADGGGDQEDPEDHSEEIPL